MLNQYLQIGLSRYCEKLSYMVAVTPANYNGITEIAFISTLQCCVYKKIYSATRLYTLIFVFSQHMRRIDQNDMLIQFLQTQINGLAQNCSNSSALALALLQFCAKLSIWTYINHSMMRAVLIDWCIGTHIYVIDLGYHCFKVMILWDIFQYIVVQQHTEEFDHREYDACYLLGCDRTSHCNDVV